MIQLKIKKEESILNLFLASDAGFTWDIMIYTDGNIYMDGAPIQDSQDLEEEIREKESGGEDWIEYNDIEEELTETERDTEGAYMGAPVGTEMPVKTPVRTPTTTPTTPKRRRGPFTRPSVKPKPKAGKKDMPEWMGFDDGQGAAIMLAWTIFLISSVLLIARSLIRGINSLE